MIHRPNEAKSCEDRSRVPIVSLCDLEHRLGESRETLRALAKNWRAEYQPFRQTKQHKPFQRDVEEEKVRNIDNPSEALKAVQRKILSRLLLPATLPHFLFGAVRSRCVNKHATEHIGGRTVVKLDIKKYYPNVTNRHVYSVWRHLLLCSPAIASLLTQLTTYEWHLPQGAPTSPALANLYLSSIYGPILEACSTQGTVATAWVDDLIFSGENARSIMEPVRQILAANGFKLSRKKRIILAGSAPKVITGIRLGAGRIRAPKDKLRDIRAAIHKLEIGHINKGEKARYVASVEGRIRNIERICADDAQALTSRFGRACQL
jgi:RNA-directed DNA polymerase